MTSFINCSNFKQLERDCSLHLGLIFSQFPLDLENSLWCFKGWRGVWIPPPPSDFFTHWLTLELKSAKFRKNLGIKKKHSICYRMVKMRWGLKKLEILIYLFIHWATNLKFTLLKILWKCMLNCVFMSLSKIKDF